MLSLDSMPVVSYYALSILNATIPDQDILMIGNDTLMAIAGRCIDIVLKEGFCENEYAMEFLATMSLKGLLHEILFSPPCREFSMKAFMSVSRQGANANFTSWLLEFIGGFLRYLGTEKDIQALLSWQKILVETLQSAEHLSGNILQLLSVIEEYFADCSPGSQAIVPFISNADFWKDSTLFYGASRLLSTNLHKNRNLFANSGSQMLEISKILLSNKSVEHVGYYFLENSIPFMVQSGDFDSVAIILTLIFSRLTSNRTLKRILDTTRLISISIISSDRSGNLMILLQRIEAIQTGLFRMIIQSLFSTCAQSSTEADKKLHIVALSSVLPQIVAMYPDYLTFVPVIYSGLLSVDSNTNSRSFPGAMACAPPDLFSVPLDSYLEPIQYFVTCAADWNSRRIVDVRSLIENMQSHQRDRILKLLNI